MSLRKILFMLCASALIAASMPALAQQGYGGGGGGYGGASGPPVEAAPSPGGQQIPQDPYSRAMLLKQKGQYSDAMPLLQTIAKQGHGYEIAQLELGKCYFDLAGRNAVPEEAAKLRTNGFAWILKAAENGLGTAEEELVRIYLDGNGVPVDRVEAAKWYFLWRRNPSRMQIGNAQFDVGLEGRLKTNLHAADWQDAQRRADNWHPL